MAKVKRRSPGLGTLVLTGFVLGILCGLFFGEMAAVLSSVGRAYVRLLQMAIIPYIMVSLIGGLGRLTPQQASRVALWGGVVLLVILALGMLLVLLVPLSYPDWESASYFSSSLSRSAESVDFVSLYIPANPFDSLANTVVPAVVLFSIAMGVAVMLSERKAPLLELLASVDEALMNITRFVVKLAPFGIFAIAANAAGTLDLTAFDKLQVYVWTYLLLWALLFFVFLPGLLTLSGGALNRLIFGANYDEQEVVRHYSQSVSNILDIELTYRDDVQAARDLIDTLGAIFDRGDEAAALPDGTLSL